MGPYISNAQKCRFFPCQFLTKIHVVFLFQFIADHVETNPLFKDSKECQGLIMEALKYHLLPERRSSFQSPRTKPRKSTVGMMFAVGGMDSNKGFLLK